MLSVCLSVCRLQVCRICLTQLQAWLPGGAGRSVQSEAIASRPGKDEMQTEMYGSHNPSRETQARGLFTSEAVGLSGSQRGGGWCPLQELDVPDAERGKGEGSQRLDI